MMKALGIALAPVVALVAMAAPASATQRCSGQPEVNVCLNIVRLPGTSPGKYSVTIGIDYRVSLQVAQDIVARGGISGAVWGDDEWDDDREFTLPRIAWGASAESGLSAEFQRTVTASELNEDSIPVGARDELYGVVVIRLPNGTTRTFNSPNINAVYG